MRKNDRGMNQLLLLIFLVGFVLPLVQGCGKDSVADQITRQKNREREAAQAQISESQSINGSYKGSGQTLDAGAYDVEAYIATALVNKDGTYVPQPMLSGAFTTYNRSKVNSKGQATKLVFPFSNGAYDSALGKLAITIQGTAGNPAILVNCDVVDRYRLDCLWHSLISDLHFKFNLIKQ